MSQALGQTYIKLFKASFAFQLHIPIQDMLTHAYTQHRRNSFIKIPE